MKVFKICITFMLIAFITFLSHAMESALTNQSRPLPLTRQTPFNEKELYSVAFNPVKPEIALGGSNIISLVDINTPDEPTALHFDCELVGGLEYNPQGTLLISGGWNEPYNPCLFYIWDLEKKKIIRSYKIDLPKTFSFNLEGNKVILATPITIWDLETDTFTQPNVTDQVSNLFISRIFNGNAFLLGDLIANDTKLWHLDNPSEIKSLDINPENYVTIFGDNEHQLASYQAFSGNGNVIQLMYDQKTTFTQVKGQISAFAYCPSIKKYFLTTTPSLKVEMLDPDTLDIKELYNFPAIDGQAPTYPTFSDDGSKLFAVTGNSEGILQFCYVDLVDNNESP